MPKFFSNWCFLSIWYYDVIAESVYALSSLYKGAPLTGGNCAKSPAKIMFIPLIGLS